MYGYQQTAYNYGTYPSANAQQAVGYVGYQQNSTPVTGTGSSTAITPVGTATNAYSNSQYSLAASAYAQYSQAAQQQQTATNLPTSYGVQPQSASDYSVGGSVPGSYGVIGGGKTKGNKTNPNTISSHYAGYEAAVYAATTNYIQEKSHPTGPTWMGGGLNQGGSKFNQGGGNRGIQKKRYGLGHQNRDMQQFFCELCKVSCAGQAAHKDHMEGKPHKRKEKEKEEAQQAMSRGRIGFRCEVCELTCSSKDTFDAHVKGQKHQRTIALLRRMGKPVPETNYGNHHGGILNETQGMPIPTVGSTGPLKKIVGVTGTKFVGGTTLLTTGEELKTSSSSGGLIPSITGAVKPQDLEKALLGDEDVKPIGEEFIEEEKDVHGKFLTYNCKLCDCKFSDIGAKDIHLKGRRHRLNYKQKVDPSLKVELKDKWGKGGKTKQPQPFVGAYVPNPASYQMAQQPRPNFPMPRNQEIMDDKHVHHKLCQIQLDPEDIRNVERLAFLMEKTLKIVSDSMVSKTTDANVDQTEPDRILKGVMRVGLLAKNLLLKSDNQIDLVVLCSKIPTMTLLKEVVELFKKNAEVADGEKLTVNELPKDSAFSISLDTIPSLACRVTFTCVNLREANNAGEVEEEKPVDPLPKQPCLNALAELRHAKFYQVKCSPLNSMNSTVKIVRDISQRVRTWAPFNTWIIELLVEKTLSSIAMPLSPGDSVRRIFEVISSGVYLSKRSKLFDPCEKEQTDVLGHIMDQEREDITSSAQHALRLIAYNQIYKILGIDRLPDALPPAAAASNTGGDAPDAKKGKVESDD